MTKFLKTGFIVAIGLLGWTACTNDDGNNATPTTEKGVPTSIQLQLNIAGQQNAGLRATNDSYATEAEARIRTVDVFIFDAQGNYVSHTPLATSEFTQITSTTNETDKYAYIANGIVTTAGPKKILVAVNFSKTFLALLENKDITHWTTVAQTLPLSELVSSDGTVAMTSTQVTDCDFVVAENSPANHPTVTVQRMVAKVSVHKAPGMKQTGIPGTLYNLSFAVNNFNNRSFLVKSEHDPNWNRYEASEYSKATTTDYALVNGSEVVNLHSFNVKYAAENSSQAHLAKELTRVTVRAGFLPTNVIVYRNDTYQTVTSVSEGANLPQTFYRITYFQPNPVAYCFFDKTTAEDYARSHEKTTADVETYLDGFCYWDLYLNKNVFDVFRNDYYRADITQIFAPGRPSQDLPNPNEPITPEREISIGGQAIDWVEYFGDTVLQP